MQLAAGTMNVPSDERGRLLQHIAARCELQNGGLRFADPPGALGNGLQVAFPD